jgi:hypothetical protein
MKKVIFCWELGGNYGHITSFLPFYRELVKAGLQVDFVLRDLGFAHQLLSDTGARYFQAPVPKDELKGAITTYTYTDLLAQIGYLDADRLTSYVNGWRDLFLLLEADIIIADHAPTALLAARTLGLPATMFGSGFFNPPLQNPMPVFHIWGNVPDDIAHQHNEPVLRSMNAVLAHFNCAPLNAVCNMFDIAERFLCTTPELDHYFGREGDEYWGPYFIDDIGIEPQWPDVPGAKIFAYITPKIKNMEYLLGELQRVSGSKLVHIPRASAELISRYSRADLRIEPTPVKMSAVVESAHLVVNQAGIGTVSACALAGVRQLLIPTQLEQRMVCKKLVSLGLAYGVDPEQDFADYQGTIEKALDCPLLGERVRIFQQKYFGFNQQEQYAVMTEVICEILNEDP